MSKECIQFPIPEDTVNTSLETTGEHSSVQKKEEDYYHAVTLPYVMSQFPPLSERPARTIWMRELEQKLQEALDYFLEHPRTLYITKSKQQ